MTKAASKPNPTRRALLQGVGAAAILVPATTVAAAAAAPTPVPHALSARFAEMVGEMDAAKAEVLRLRSTIPDTHEYEDVATPSWDRRFEMMNEIRKTPPLTLGDVIAKLRVLGDPMLGLDTSTHDHDGLCARQCLGWLMQQAVALTTTQTGQAAADPLIALDAERQRWTDLANDALTDEDINRYSASAALLAVEMLAIPAVSTAGVLVKLRAGDHAWGDNLTDSAMEDLARLSGGAA